jgi:hypothetical protein
MNPSFTRRQVLRLALNGSAMVASCAVAASGRFALAIFAGAPTSTVLLGLRGGNIPAGGPANAVPLVAQSMDFVTGQIQLKPVPQVLQDGTTPVLSVNDAITGFTVLIDGTLVLVTTPITGSKHASDPSRLTRLIQTTAVAVSVSGLNRQQQLASVVATTSGPVLGLVQNRNGTSPVRLVAIDPQTGALTEYANLHLPSAQRFTTLAQCPDGQVYSTAVGRDGHTTLVRLDTGEIRALTFDGLAWNNGLANLVCSPSNELLALGAPRYKTPNALYSVDPSSGVMSWVRDFDVGRLTVAHI